MVTPLPVRHGFACSCGFVQQRDVTPSESEKPQAEDFVYSLRGPRQARLPVFPGVTDSWRCRRRHADLQAALLEPFEFEAVLRVTSGKTWARAGLTSDMRRHITAEGDWDAYNIPTIFYFPSEMCKYLIRFQFCQPGTSLGRFAWLRVCHFSILGFFAWFRACQIRMPSCRAEHRESVLFLPDLLQKARGHDLR